MILFTDMCRAFTSNLGAISARDNERACLDATGVHEPAIQRYFVWRRSVVLIVVLSTVLSAGLATYRELTEADERPGVFDTIGEDLLEHAKTVPLAAHALDDSDDESTPDEAPAKNGGGEVSLLPAQDRDDDEPQTAFGRFADGVHLASLYALPAAALAVVVFWTRLKLTFRILMVGFAFGFFVPLLLALCPWSWWGYVEPEISRKDQPVQFYKLMAEGILEGAGYLITLLPNVLSLVPGVQRACVRVKTLFPASMLPGWFLMAASPFYALFLLVIFVAINQVATDPLFLGGMLLILAAPLVYVVQADAFTSPLTSDADYRRIRRVERIVGGLTALAGIMLATYLATRQLFGIHLVGLDEKTSLLRPIDLLEFFLEFVGRSMFMTVLGADLLVKMNLTVWKSDRAFKDSPEAKAYDRVMGEMERISP